MSPSFPRLIAAASFVFLSFSSYATVIACPAGIADNVSGAVACQYSASAAQDFLNTAPMTVNDEQFFSHDDWAFAGKIGETAGFAGDGAGSAGGWSIPDLDANDIMLVFKSGSDTSLVAYLLAADLLSGQWSSPFENPPFTALRDTKAVSHISVYARGPSLSVPSPAPWQLLALPVLALLARRRQA